MAERLADRLLAHLHDAFPGDRSYRREDFTHRSDVLPEPIARYLSVELREHAGSHVREIEADPWVDGQDEKLRTRLDGLEEALDGAVRFPADVWHDRLEEAVRRVCRFVRTPIDELVEVVFRESSTLPVELALRRMEYFQPYGYLQDVFRAYLERKSVKIVDRDRFDTVLRRIDREMVADYDVDQWTRLMQPVYRLARPLADPGSDARVPVSMLREAADSRAFTGLADALTERSEDALTLEQFRRSVERALSERTRKPKTDPADTPVSTTPQEEPDGDSGPRPRWQQFRQNQSRSSGATEPPSSDAPDSEDPLWKKFQRPSEASDAPDDSSSAGEETEQLGESDPLEEIEREVVGLIPGDQRQRFISKLFDGSRDEYNRILRRLSQIGTWEQASSIIADEVFIPHQVNIYSEPAVTFTDLVEARYREEPAS